MKALGGVLPQLHRTGVSRGYALTQAWCSAEARSRRSRRIPARCSWARGSWVICRASSRHRREPPWCPGTVAVPKRPGPGGVGAEEAGL